MAPPSAVAADPPSCLVRPEQTEGPYFVDERLNRSDIRADPSDGSVREGVPLTFRIAVGRIDGAACTALAGVVVDIWHCDAAGIYSDVQDNSFNAVGRKFLRGYQVTDANGVATFVTIYPGWYPGRTVHIHFKIRTDPDSSAGFEFTSQLYFDDTLSDAVFAQQPYAAEGTRTTRNANDGIYGSGGDELLLDATADGQGGYVASFAIGLDIGDVTAPSACATTTACLAELAAALPDPASASSRKARRKARRIVHWNAAAADAIVKAEAGSGAKQTRQYARARKALTKLLAASQAADSAGLLDVELAPIEAAVATLLSLLP
jgi:protocatechuate 3,4-dioxygenase beta subunit